MRNAGLRCNLKCIRVGSVSVMGMRIRRFRMFLWGAALAAMLLAAPGGKFVDRKSVV